MEAAVTVMKAVAVMPMAAVGNTENAIHCADRPANARSDRAAHHGSGVGGLSQRCPVRQRLGGEVAVADLDARMQALQFGDGLGGKLARNRMAAQRAGIDVQEFHGGFLTGPGARRRGQDIFGTIRR